MMKINKSNLNRLLFLVILIIPALLLGQTNNFEFVQYDTAYVGSEEFVVLYGNIFNLTDTDQEITVSRVTHSIPSAWSSSFCVGPVCLPPLIDAYTYTLSPRDTAFFSLDTFPFGEIGMGSWTMFVTDSSTMEVDSVFIIMEYIAPTSIDAVAAPTSFNLSPIYPNPTNAWINFDLEIEYSGFYSVILYALDGREVLSREYDLRAGKNQLQWSMEGLPSGNYIIRATNAGRSISRQVSVIK